MCVCACVIFPLKPPLTAKICKGHFQRSPTDVAVAVQAAPGDIPPPRGSW